jgi:hypothetical protein
MQKEKVRQQHMMMQQLPLRHQHAESSVQLVHGAARQLLQHLQEKQQRKRASLLLLLRQRLRQLQ